MFGFGKKEKPAQRRYSPNPHKGEVRSFFSGESDRFLSGWTTDSSSIDFYLGSELPKLRARSKELVRRNPYGKRFITSLKSNIVGPNGICVQAQSTWNRKGSVELDTTANDAIEKAWKDWSRKANCDYFGKNSFRELCNLAISNAGQDGEYIFRLHIGRKFGKYGLQVQLIDSELLDVTRNETTRNGEIRLGVEYDGSGRIIRYHFRKRHHLGQYFSGEKYSVPAESIIHGYIHEWTDQSRGIPWMHASLERSKMLDKYDEAAMVAARVGASKAMFLSSKAGDAYEGEEGGEGYGANITHVDPGVVEDIGDREIQSYDPSYPHQMYDSFHKNVLRAISSGIGVSYHSISNDLEGVNYSSIRAGVLEDREIFKGLQEWFIEQFIEPLYRRWIDISLLVGAIKVGSIPLRRNPEEYYAAHFQARRWAWVDPQKDGQANDTAINNRTKTRTQIISEQGGDFETVARQIAREEKILAELGVSPVKKESEPEKVEDDAPEDE